MVEIGEFTQPACGGQVERKIEEHVQEEHPRDRHDAYNQGNPEIRNTERFITFTAREEH